MSLPISGFTAIPNPQMLAFMAIQSFIMMYQAGEGWQYGKRKQSAMSNEDFNRQTPISIMQNQAATLQAALPTIQKSLNAMTPLIHIIVEQYGDFAKEIIKVLPETIKSVTGGLTPEQIVQAGLDAHATSETSFPTQTGSERQALADMFQKLLDIRAGPASGPTLESLATSVHDLTTVVKNLAITSHNLPPKEGPPSPFPPKGTVVHYQPPTIKTSPAPFLGGPAPSFTGTKPTTYQPTGGSPLATTLKAIDVTTKLIQSEQYKQRTWLVQLAKAQGQYRDSLMRLLAVSRTTLTRLQARLTGLKVTLARAQIRR